ncbi:N-acetyltransferase [Leuconostoc litchii]|nr:N-acetyltransferase [Leuconostoc litchii]
MFDMNQPITFSLEEASLSKAVEWQQLIQQLMRETDTFLIASMRDEKVDVESTDYPAITLLLIAEQGGASSPVGIGSIEHEEIGIAVLKQYQGAGLGQELMNSLLEWAQINNLPSVWLDVQTDNVPAVHIYQKYGFRNVGSQQRYILPNGRVTQVQKMILEL